MSNNLPDEATQERLWKRAIKGSVKALRHTHAGRVVTKPFRIAGLIYSSATSDSVYSSEDSSKENNK